MEHDEDYAQEKDETAVTVVTKHDCEQEGEGNDCETCGVRLAVAGDTISVGNKLRRSDDVVVLEIGRRRKQHFFVLVLAPGVEFNCREILKGTFHRLLHCQGAPDEASQGDVRSISLL